MKKERKKHWHEMSRWEKISTIPPDDPAWADIRRVEVDAAADCKSGFVDKTLEDRLDEIFPEICRESFEDMGDKTNNDVPTWEELETLVGEVFADPGKTDEERLMEELDEIFPGE